MADTFRMKVHSSDVRSGCPFTHVNLPLGFEAQAQKNHGQSFERLNERGGLGIIEMAWIINGVSWKGAEFTAEKAMSIVEPFADRG